MTKEMASSLEDPGEGDSLRMAIKSRTRYLREQAESLTLEKFRRLLEEDLGMERFQLDNHKRMIKQLVHEVLDTPGQNEVLDSADGDMEDDISTHDNKEELNEEHRSGEENVEKPNDDVKAASPCDNSGNKEIASNFDEKDVEPSIRKAIMKRATYLREHSESISLQQVRRLLETDLELPEFQLDIHKQLVKKLVDEILCSSDEPTREPKMKRKRNEGDKEEKADVKKSKPLVKKPMKDVQQKHKKPKHTSDDDAEDVGEQNSEPDQNYDTEDSGEKIQKILCSSDEPTREPKMKKKRKEGDKEEKADVKRSKPSVKKPRKDVQQKDKKPKHTSDDEAEDVGETNLEPDQNYDTEDSIEEIQKGLVKKSNVVKPAHNKLIERLREVIKASGLNVGPHIYRKAKQAPEEEHDQVLVKELEAILSREGLSVNASEKEIKAVRRRRERQKDLEDIDTGNIILEPRGRRQVASFVLQKPEKKDDPDDEEHETSSDEEEENSSDEEDEIVSDEDDDGAMNTSQDEPAPSKEDLTGDDESD